MGFRVILTEETDWLGGQLTSQLVPPDENLWIEGQGCTLRYRKFRDSVRQYYRDHYPLLPEVRSRLRLNPGKGQVSPICHEPRVSVAVLDQMLAYARCRGFLDVTDLWPANLSERTPGLFADPNTKPAVGQQFSAWWPYRRIVHSDFYPGEIAPHEVTIVNWPHNDYMCGNIIDKPEQEVARHLEASRQQTLSLVYWLQTERPRPDGGQGYPSLFLRPDIAGTRDGLAKSAYICESRRIRAVFTITEGHIGAIQRGAWDTLCNDNYN